MRDEYVGDVGDFGKYILLDELSGISKGKVKIGINWYYNVTPLPINNLLPDKIRRGYIYLSDGKGRYRNLNRHMFDSLRSIVFNNDSTPQLSDIENKKVVKDCLFYRKPIPYSQPTKERRAHREQWFQESLNTLDGADVIFLDPDNGVAPFTVTKSQTDSVKYVFVDEIKRYYDLKKSLIIYQHRDFSPMVDFTSRFMTSLLHIKPQCFPLFLRFSRVSVRYYALIARTEKHNVLFAKLFNKLTNDYAYLFGSCD
ncbi:MAG: hypothetical protein A4E71_02826 [Smithella sp. PtaU1.Bin162]|nr:MAG: hypothetical protein A4E71_02826 [Smithella sp. PtaU1.Bin162]